MPLYSSDGEVYEDTFSYKLGVPIPPKEGRGGGISITPIGSTMPSPNALSDLPSASDDERNMGMDWMRDELRIRERTQKPINPGFMQMERDKEMDQIVPQPNPKEERYAQAGILEQGNISITPIGVAPHSPNSMGGLPRASDEPSTVSPPPRDDTIIPPALRVFSDSLSGNRAPIDNTYFSRTELETIRSAAQKRIAEGKPDIGYGDYGEQDPWTTGTQGFFQALTDPNKSLAYTLGMAQVKQEEDGTIVVKDKYDFAASKAKVDALKQEGIPAIMRMLMTGLKGNGLLGVSNVVGNLMMPEGEGRDVELRIPPGDLGPKVPITTPHELAAERTKRSVTNVREEGKMSQSLDMVGQDIMRMATTPKRMVDAIQRKYNPSGEISDSDQLPEDMAAEFAFDMLSAGLTSAPFKPGVGMFGGRFTPQSLYVAEELEKKGMSKQAVKELTGLERGAEGMWRKEFSDHKSKVSLNNLKSSGDDLFDGKPYKSAYLNEVLDHPDLYRIYPEAKNIPVFFVDDLALGNTNVWGYYRSQTGEIFMNSKISKKDMHSVLLHELQHWVQHQEGFTLITKSQIPDELMDKLKKIWIDFEVPKSNQKIIQQVVETGRVPMGMKFDDLEKYAAKVLANADYSVYRRLSTEVEARNVQTRMHMTDDQRRRKLAIDTEDFKRPYQVIDTPDKKDIKFGSTYFNAQEDGPDNSQALSQEPDYPFVIGLGSKISEENWEEFIKSSPRGNVEVSTHNPMDALEQARSAYTAGLMLGAPKEIMKALVDKYKKATREFDNIFEGSNRTFNKWVDQKVPQKDLDYIEKLFPGFQKFLKDQEGDPNNIKEYKGLMDIIR